MKDRQPTRPGRVKLTRAGGTVEYVTIERADEPTEAGTPLNKGTFLQDDTAALYGKGTNAVPDDIFREIKTDLAEVQEKAENDLAQARVEIESDLAQARVEIESDITNTELFSFLGSVSNRVVETITTSQTWKAPSNMVGNAVLAVALGGAGGDGGAGGKGGGTNGGNGGLGGKGGSGNISVKFLKIDPNANYSCIIGAAGTNGTDGTNGASTSSTGGTGGNGTTGGATSFGELFTAPGGTGGSGGAGGKGSSTYAGGAGGKGGNGGAYGGGGGGGNGGIGGGSGGAGGNGGTYGKNGGSGSSSSGSAGSGGSGGSGKTFQGPIMFAPAIPSELTEYLSTGKAGATNLGGGGGGYGGEAVSTYGGGFGPIQKLLGEPNFGASGKLVLIYPVEVGN